GVEAVKGWPLKKVAWISLGAIGSAAKAALAVRRIHTTVNGPVSRCFMCGWPPPGKDNFACRTEVACSHVSGLFTQFGWTDRRQAVPGRERDDEIAMDNSAGVWR